jgi:hypothetical protein
MSESQSADPPWLSLSNRADGLNADNYASTVRLANEDGTQLREDVCFDSLEGIEAVDWQEATDRFGDWYDGQRDTKIVIENELGEQSAFNTPNRFTPEYREMLYARSQALERGLRERWGKLLHTAMVTLTASTTDDSGRSRPPVEHLQELLSSWESVRRSLHRVLEDREWEYLAIIEPHESGYAHVHLGVFVKGPVVVEQFEPVLDAHVRNCRSANQQAHELTEQVTVRKASHPSRNNGVENLGAYLAAYMAGEYGTEATEMPAHVQRFYTIMWATGRQWFRPSNGAQELMQPPDDGGVDEHDWQLVGIAPDGEPDEELIEIDPTCTAGARYRRLRTDMPPTD